ncbi:hypothetical protein BDA96_01G292100 [Sorghum bicolor]|uniref:Protein DETOXIFICATION n=2 Tax=Sorghum bicolor TaxID=4558 RepID=A0A921S1Y2_SORBI|nr:protein DETOXIFICATION 33 isoform X2 [Sorghum bicolor]KAG0549875.1 hypothetical protein BDA96_01G292100 [Sorghum bicolor]KXG38739.1 hypothetical protein SORBI_3001G273000 [Sorghum bicolor]|eukprot:XP_021311242.1 protein DETOXIFICATION 33 isoform X2 [Sorghum bicolor]
MLIMKRLVSQSWEESRLLWRLTFPVLLAEVFQFSIGFVTTAFVGHLGDVELAAVTVAENILDTSAYGLLFGMGSALNTLIGQAVGAGQLDRLGTYTQQSLIICGTTALALAPVYIFATPILQFFLHQPVDVSRAAGQYARWAIPRLFANAMDIPLLMFFRGQSRVWTLAAISGVALAVHTVLTYIAVRQLGYGLPGAAVAGDISQWLIVAAQFAYMIGGRFPDTWKGFTMCAFNNIGAFVKLSLGSAVMICLEFWYNTTLLILVGLLKHAKFQLDIMSVCLNYEFMAILVAMGFSTAIGIRVSNELGAKRPMETRFAVLVAVSTSIFMGSIFMGVVLIWRTSLPKLFSDSEEVIHGASKLGLLLALTVWMISICPVLSGVAVGAGWQVSVAFINIGCFYLVGIPMGILFGIKLKHGTMGIWMGMLTGTFLQMAILLAVIFTTNWDKQAALTEERMAEWGGKEKLPLMKSPHTDDQMTPALEKMLAQDSKKNVDLLCTE